MSVLSPPGVGDAVRIDGVDHVVVQFLIQTDELVLEDGRSIFVDQLRPYTDFHLLDAIDDVEAYLAAPEWTISTPAKPVVKTDVVRCDHRSRQSQCGCSWCYHEYGLDEDGKIVTRHHFVDSRACQCNAGRPHNAPLRDCGCR